MTFRVGQKVVCVLPVDDLRRDEIYCVGSVAAGHNGILIGVNKSMFNARYPAFYAKRFRPIVERKTEVSFTTGADPSSEQFDNRRVKVGASA
jgi:hypothetical protein